MDLQSLTLAQLLDRVSAKTPVPGGGAVTATIGALAAALTQMTVNYSVGKKDLAPHAAAQEAALAHLKRARWLLLELAAEDIKAYEDLNSAMKTPKDDPARPALLAQKALAAIQPPIATIAACAELLRLFETLAPITNRFLLSDLAIAAIFAEATARASYCNVRINLPLIERAVGEQQRAQADAMLQQSAARLRAIENSCHRPPP